MSATQLMLLVTGMVLGAVTGWFISRAHGRAAIAAGAERLSAREREVASFKESLAGREQELSSANRDCASAREEVAALRAQIEAVQKGSDEKLNALLDVDKNLRESFKSLAGEALDANSQRLLALAKKELETQRTAADGALKEKHTAFGELVKPISDNLSTLRDQVTRLQKNEEDLLRETRTLSTALRQGNVRGRWGELQLKRIAELSGMLERCDFMLQETLQKADGGFQRPDMIVHLPNHRSIVVDAKAPYDAYEQASALEDPDLRTAKLREYAQQVRTQIDLLATKGYAKNVAGSADFVVCFLPGESFFAAAIAADPFLLEYAAQKDVVLASPSSLITLLRAVALGWREQQLAVEARHICALGQELYTRLSAATDHFEKLRRSLNGTVDSYNKLVGSLERSVLPQARKFKSLSATGKEMDVLEPMEETARMLQGPDWERDDPRLLLEEKPQ
jgi:DNA recombination protein RmuC